jgi:hypothetical protein
MLYLMFVRLAGWLALLARSAASKETAITADTEVDQAIDPPGPEAGYLALVSVPTVTCGQLRVLKLSSTIWEYCSCVGSDWPCRVSSQKVAVAEAATAFGPCDPPCRNAVFAVPPPGTEPSPVDTCKIVVEAITARRP